MAMNIADPAARDSRLDTLVKALSGGVAQPLCLGGNIPRCKSGGIVADIAVEGRADVNADYIARFDDALLAWYAVNDLIVYGNA